MPITWSIGFRKEREDDTLLVEPIGEFPGDGHYVVSPRILKRMRDLLSKYAEVQYKLQPVKKGIVLYPVDFITFSEKS